MVLAMTTATMTDQGYSSREICHAAELSYRELDHWARLGVITPSLSPQISPRPYRDSKSGNRISLGHAPGSGSARRWSEGDLIRIRVLKLLRVAGVELSRLRHPDLSAVRADIEHAFEEAVRAGLCG